VIRHQINVLHLVRNNHLDVIISREVRRATNTTHRVESSTGANLVQVTLDPQDTVRRLRALQRNINLARRLIRLSPVPSLEISYEALLEDYANFEPVWEFLHISKKQAKLESRLVKLVRGDYPELIRNYDDVQQVIKDTEFAYLLER
jgi:hypothetical protein